MYINVSEGIYYVENPEAEGFSEIAPYCFHSKSMFWVFFWGGESVGAAGVRGNGRNLEPERVLDLSLYVLCRFQFSSRRRHALRLPVIISLSADRTGAVQRGGGGGRREAR